VSGVGDGGADGFDGGGRLEGDGLGVKVWGDLGLGIDRFDGFDDGVDATGAHDRGDGQFHSH